MALKIPPPPPIASMDPAFNRWLLELTSILANEGGIDPDTIDGYPALVVQVNANTAAIANNDNSINALQAGLGNTNAAVAALDARVTTAEGNITTLQARATVYNGTTAPPGGLGVDGDWYGRTDAGNRAVFVKVSGAWVQIAS